MALIEITEKTYVSQLWFFSFGGGDWMGCLFKNEDAEKWSFNYRFRYYGAPAVEGVEDPFTDDDRKSGYEGTMEGEEDEVRSAVDQAVDLMMRAHPNATDLHAVPVRGGLEAFTEVMKKQTWMHARSMN